jgi:hypothetical protein
MGPSDWSKACLRRGQVVDWQSSLPGPSLWLPGETSPGWRAGWAPAPEQLVNPGPLAVAVAPLSW